MPSNSYLHLYPTKHDGGSCRIGNYIVDFYCHKARLVIELDGGQHYSLEGKQKDRIRDKYLQGLGLKILRFSDSDIFENIDGVLEIIWRHCKQEFQ